MVLILQFLLATLLSGLLAGGSLGAFSLATGAAIVAVWYSRLNRRNRADKELYATLDPKFPDGEVIIKALSEAASLVRQHLCVVQVRLTVPDAATRRALSTLLTLTRHADVEVICHGHAFFLKQPGVWIADLPIPLSFPRMGSMTLRLEPTTGHRIRIKRMPVAPTPTPLFWVGLAVGVAMACIFDWPCLLGMLVAFAIQMRLLQDYTHGT